MKQRRWLALLLGILMAVTCIPVSGMQKVSAAEASGADARDLYRFPFTTLTPF